MLYDILGTAVDCVNGDGDDGFCDDQLNSVGNGAVVAAGPATDQDGVALPLAPCSGLDGGTGQLGDQLVMEYDFLAAVDGYETAQRDVQYVIPTVAERAGNQSPWLWISSPNLWLAVCSCKLPL
jgi:hypothetical protein